MNAQDLTIALGGKWRNGTGLAPCPAHDDRHPSLSISDGHTHPVVFKCHSGCPQFAVIESLSAMGLWSGGVVYEADAVNRELVPEPERRDFQPVWKAWRDATNHAAVEKLAKDLGVDDDALARLDCVWAHSKLAFAFPMRDETGKMIGIRLRNSTRKWAVLGSRAGCFVPQGFGTNCETVFVTEGPTCASAAISIGLEAIGRPSCSGQEQMIAKIVSIAKRVVIVADNDDPGRRGAETLQRALTVPSAIWIPPAKDMRTYVQKGGDADTIMAMVGSHFTHPHKREER